jgi:hypothetical protein
MMSQINGDKARFQKNRRRKLRTRERIREMVAKLQPAAAGEKAAKPAKAGKAAKS